MALINCENITVKNLTILPSEPLVLLAFTSNSIIAENRIIDEYGLTGIVIRNSTNNQILNNNITSNYPVYKRQSFGVYVVDSSDIIISNNDVEGFWRGVSLTNSNFNDIVGNNVSKSNRGIVVFSGQENKVFGNRVFSTVEALTGSIFPDSGIGISVSNNNSVFGNTFERNGVGLRVDGTNIFIYQNNFLNNTDHMDLEQSTSVLWDANYKGNYWDSYEGNDTNGDGIGDTPFILDDYNQDNYPLMKPVDISEIPEFSSVIILPMFLVLPLIIIIIRGKMKRKT